MEVSVPTQRRLFIVNPAAGRAALERWRAFATTLHSKGVDFEEAVAAKPGDALTLARKAAGDGGLIGAVGGDGTVFEVLNGLFTEGPRAALTVVPLGTGNDIARMVGIRTETDALCAITAGESRAIDLIEIHCRINGTPAVRHAMLFAAVGITSDLLKHTTPRLKRCCGQRFAYILGILLALRSHSPSTMKIACDGRTIEGPFLLACASNGETFGGGIKIAPGALPNDRKLNVNLIEAVGFGEAVRHLPKLLRGRHTTHTKVHYEPATSLMIETEKPVEVAADGDLIGYTPATFKIRTKALQVLCPTGAGLTGPSGGV